MSTAEDFPVGTRVRFGTGGRGVVADPDNPLTLALDRTYRPEGLVYVWDDRTTPGKRVAPAVRRCAPGHLVASRVPAGRGVMSVLVEFLVILAVSVPGTRLFRRQLRAEAREQALLAEAERLLETVDWFAVFDLSGPGDLR
jgi:hypothetical protein